MSEPQQVEHKTEARFPMRGQNYEPLPSGKSGSRIQTHAAQTINATPDEVYNVYAEPRMLHLWQEGIISVTETGKNKLHWVAEDPGMRKRHEFDSEIVETARGRKHVSRITSGPLKGSTYTALFEEHPAGRGCIFTMIGDFHVPGGRFSNALAGAISRNPERILVEDVRHLKQLLESGEIPRVDYAVAGPRGASGKVKQFMLGEHLSVPPGTSDRPQTMDLRSVRDGSEKSSAASTAIFIAVPVIAAAAIWGLFNRKQ